jgi:hypothetical protein
MSAEPRGRISRLMKYEPLLPTGDATLRCYERTFDQLTIEIALWDESTKIVTAFGVTDLVDVGTWEVDAIVRVPELDGDGLSGYGIVDTEDNLTLRFAAQRIEL